MTDTANIEVSPKSAVEISAASDEQTVRDTWEFLHAYLTAGTEQSPSRFIVLIYTSKTDDPGGPGYLARFEGSQDAEGRAKAWADAAAYTRDRKEEARRIQVGIDHLLRLDAELVRPLMPARVLEGILAREKSIKSIVEKGMKRAA